MKRIILLLTVILLVLLLMPTLVLAQGTEAPITEIEGTPVPNYLTFAAVVVLFATQILKTLQVRFLPEKWQVDPRFIAIFLMAVVALIYEMASSLGVNADLQEVFRILEAIINSIGDLLLRIAGGTVVATVAYRGSTKYRLPGFVKVEDQDAPEEAAAA